MAYLDDLLKTLRLNKTKILASSVNSVSKWYDPYGTGTEEIPDTGGTTTYSPDTGTTTYTPDRDDDDDPYDIGVTPSPWEPIVDEEPVRDDRDDGGGTTAPLVTTAPPVTAVVDTGMPERQEDRTYSSLTAEQFFTEMYNVPEYADYWTPFTQDGTPWEDLATTYAGLPVVSGYWTGEGENKVFTPEKSLYNISSQLLELKNTDFPAFQDWLATTGGAFVQDITKTAPYAGMEAIAADFNDLTDEMQDAWNAAAKANGFVLADGTGDGAAYSAYIESQRKQKDLGVMGQAGVLGTDYETAARKVTQASVEQIVESNMQMIESLGMKSAAAAYTKLNEISNTIQNMLLQSDFKLLEQDLLMREIEYEALLRRSEQAADTGLAAGSQFLEMLVNNRWQALESYGIQIDAILKNNAQTLQQYGVELERITMHVETTYKSIMTEIGYDEHLMQQSEDLYNQYMQNYWDQLEEWYQSELIRQGDEAIAASGGGGGGLGAGLLGGLGGAAAGFAVGSVPGAIVGAIIGFFGGLFS